MPTDDDDDRTYDVVVNDEEQYSIWLVGRDVPAGWHTVGVRGTKRECLDYIEVTWTDMRPRSLRERLERLRAEVAAEHGQ
jgi:MbtH protein